MAENGFSFWTAVAFTVNYIMGCGFLGIPHAFVASGVVLGPCIIILFCYLVNMTKDFVLEAMARTEALVKVTGGETAYSDLTQSDYLVSSTRKFEVTDLFGRLIGPRARTAYVLVLSGYLYGGLLSYAVVFASSFAANVPLPAFNGGRTCNVETDGAECLPSFYFWLALFGAMAVPLSCMELREQVSLQVAMFGARLLVVVLMTGTAIAGWSCGGIVFIDQGTDHAPNVPLAVPAGLAQIMPIATYAFIFHHSVPILSQPVADKRSLPRVFLAAFMITGIAYASLGGVLAVWFGEAVESQANLNWQYYVGCVAPPAGGGPVNPSSRSGLAAAIAFVILIFPALDVLSAYPLNAITLGNNLMSACSPAAVADLEGEDAADDAKDAQAAHGSSSGLLERLNGDETRPSDRDAGSAGNAWNCWGRCSSRRKAVRRWTRARCTRVAFRLVAASPPIVAAALSTRYGVNLGQILQFTGLIGVAIAFGIPSVLRAWSYAASLRFHAQQSAQEGDESGGSGPTESGAYSIRTEQGGLLLRGGGGSSDKLVHGASGDHATAPRGVLVPGVRWRDLLSTPLQPPAGLQTPYSHWSVRYGGDRAIFVVAVTMAGFVLSQMFAPS